MKKSILVILLFVGILNIHAATTIYNQDGVQLTQTITKVNTVFCTALNKNVIIWKSELSLLNTNSEAVNLTRPIFFKFNRAYISSVELNAIRNQGVGYNVSSAYKNILTESNTVLNANQVLNSEKYFVTFDNVNLDKEAYSWDLQYVK